ncbi:homoserine kinase [bacterium BMS3Bbin02]|nr:homoserine kinase [bacterium BMS3Bbin02]
MIGKATAPASSANLGPGFDCLGLALELRCAVTAAASDRWELEEGGMVSPLDPVDLVLAAARMVGDEPCRITIANEIPRARGLGSSAAVIVATVAAVMRSRGVEPAGDDLFVIANRLEGHGDNAGAAVFGGLVAASRNSLAHLALHPSIRIVAAIPDSHLRTDAARDVLPAQVSHRAAVRNVGRLAFLMEGLRTGDADILAMARGDELHESYRSSLSRVTGGLISAAIEAGAMHAAWSGAGPTALAFATEDTTSVVIEALEQVLDGDGEVRQLAVATTGWT